MLLDGLILSIVIGWFRGGSLKRLASAEFRCGWLIIAAFAFQNLVALAQSYLELPKVAAFLGIILAYLVLLVVVWLNWRDRWILLVGLGVLLNFIVIILNGGMPVSLEVVRQYASPEKIKAVEQLQSALHIPMTDRTVFKFLSDIIPLPPPYPHPQIVSVGDVLVSLGVFAFIQRHMVYRGKRRTRLFKIGRKEEDIY